MLEVVRRIVEYEPQFEKYSDELELVAKYGTVAGVNEIFGPNPSALYSLVGDVIASEKSRRLVDDIRSKLVNSDEIEEIFYDDDPAEVMNVFRHMYENDIKLYERLLWYIGGTAIGAFAAKRRVPLVGRIAPAIYLACGLAAAWTGVAIDDANTKVRLASSMRFPHTYKYNLYSGCCPTDRVLLDRRVFLLREQHDQVRQMFG